METGFLGYEVHVAFTCESEKAQHFLWAYGAIHGSANLEMDSYRLMTTIVEPGLHFSVKTGVTVVPADFRPYNLATSTPIWLLGTPSIHLQGHVTANCGLLR